MKDKPLFSFGKFSLLGLILLFSFMSAAQENKPINGIVASVQPLFALNNALRLDVEMKLQNKNLNFIISPEFYKGYASDNKFILSDKKRGIDEVEGIGIGVSHKIDFNSNRNTYFNYGLMYRDLNITYEDEGYIPYQRDGLSYYEYGLYVDKLKISSILLDACIGIQSHNFGRFILDFYIGGGYKTSSKTSNYNGRSYDQHHASYAYNGFVFRTGIKAGFKIK
ncbi:MAG: hypothetical protein ACO1N7_08980 [Sphingobacteriaceae bacterium]